MRAYLEVKVWILDLCNIGALVIRIGFLLKGSIKGYYKATIRVSIGDV